MTLDPISSPSPGNALVAGEPFVPSTEHGPDTLPFELGTLPSICLPTNTPESVGNTKLIAEIARGGMGVVLRAIDTVFDREIAVKVLQEQFNNAKYQQRFITEARITARLQHPGIVPIFEAGRFPDGRPYFTMRLVKGMNFKQLLSSRKNPRHELSRHLKIFDQICQTVAYAHYEGVIHRDLKPSNIMIAPFGVVKVLDWGIAKVIKPSNFDIPEFEVTQPPEEAGSPEQAPSVEERTKAVTEVGSILGTPEYMPPEQARCDWKRLDERADVFSLGAILCEILTGRAPYEGKSPIEVLRKASAGELLPAFERLDSSLAERELVQLAKSCLAKRVKDRPRDAGVVAQALARYLESDLRRAERDLVRFFELSLDLFCLASMDGFFLRVNSNFSRVLGYSSDELLSKPFLEFVYPEDRQSTLEIMKDLTKGLPVVRFRNRYRHMNGHYLWLEWTAKSVPEEALIFAVARDVTDVYGSTEML